VFFIIIHHEIEPGTRQHNMNYKLIITLFSLFGELERDLVSSRTKEALSAKKAQGQILGKPKGTIQKSKFDAHQERIKEPWESACRYGKSPEFWAIQIISP
jgi:DNA invertase Pin-like site-specific DNA recombinase